MSEIDADEKKTPFWGRVIVLRCHRRPGSKRFDSGE